VLDTLTRALLRLTTPRNLGRLFLSILLVHFVFYLALAAQPEASALYCIPWFFYLALVWAYAVGAEALLLLLTTGMTALGLSLQLSLNPSDAEKLLLFYLLGFGAAAVAAAFQPLLCRCPFLVLGGSLTLSAVLALILRLSAATNGAHLSISVAGVSVQPIEVLKLLALLAEAAVLTDDSAPSPSRRAFVVLLFYSGAFAVLNEFGSLLVVLGTVLIMTVIERPFWEYAGWLGVFILLVAAAFALCQFAAGLAEPGVLVLPARIYNKIANRFLYANIMDTSALDTTGDAYQAVQAWKMMLLSDFWSKSPWTVYVPVIRSDLIICYLMHEHGLVSVYILSTALFVFAAVTMASSCRSIGFTSVLGLGSGCCIVIGALVNMLGGCGLLPLTGIPLPFISSGGSSLVISMVLLAFALRSTIRDANQTFGQDAN